VQAAGVTSLRGIAKALNERGVPTATGKGKWEAMQVGRVLERLAPESTRSETETLAQRGGYFAAPRLDSLCSQ
jgi:hypothetical protein